MSLNVESSGSLGLSKIAGILLFLLCATSCSEFNGGRIATGTGTSSVELCQLVAGGKSNDGRHVRVRAAFGSGAEYVND